MSVVPWGTTTLKNDDDDGEATTDSDSFVTDDGDDDNDEEDFEFGIEQSVRGLPQSPSRLLLPLSAWNVERGTVVEASPLAAAPTSSHHQYVSPLQRPGLRKLRSDEDPNFRRFRFDDDTGALAHQGDESKLMDSSNHSVRKESGVEEGYAIPSHNSTPTLSTTTTATTTASSAANKPVIEVSPASIRQLVVGALGIYSTYLYYGHVQEDLFRYRNPETGRGFEYFWALQMLESFVTMTIGYIGRAYTGSGVSSKGLPLIPFFKSGASQLTAKALMSMSLAAGLSFPVVTLAKSAKIVPVMIGQFLLGGSSYSLRDYTFAILIVVGTALLSAGKTSRHHDGDSTDTWSGLILILLSLVADGFTGGLQKKLKQVTATMAPTTYDFLFFSHIAQVTVAAVISGALGELHAAPVYLIQNPSIQHLVVASCICSAVGQCFIFYVISCFDPLVCTTITTTRKMFTVLLSIGLKGHILSSAGCLGLGLACTALLVEVEGKVATFRRKLKQEDPLRKPLLPTTTSSASL